MSRLPSEVPNPVTIPTKRTKIIFLVQMDNLVIECSSSDLTCVLSACVLVFRMAELLNSLLRVVREFVQMETGNDSYFIFHEFFFRSRRFHNKL